MPYIADAIRRGNLASGVAVPEDSGELAYTLATVIDEYLSLRGINYERLAGVQGTLACLSHEIQRRIIDPYEDDKRHENGDVFFSVVN